ncbi:pantetheine-phosphate adenylyltransferase [Rhodoluna lacicola]|mgnify:CR=1 FL=1|jgi:pantetheine-phosphate adenylyltransferase|uniref:Phosphopantetheine adenylyltransferase n=1 Tax=Rhodoluna lacicola TaxID=529884 RepID=A0A060JGR8_9MICO|nr:pantetheine-phosphate adenylyltransferase [Rhodoluna lacicola]AIC47712.1 pantetheine-phosphate adenylyltransferase, bacterial [Rhodoluna lacicola]BDS50610.1 phosphopantetheine adenylyltransferase [Rhodoluna lacicola]
MPTIAVYPGSFDPITLGHLDIAARAANLFDEVHILVVHNPGKSPRFSSEERVELIRTSLAELKISGPAKISVDTLDGGLLVNYCKMVGATALVKGFRTSVDLDYELPMAQVNRDLAAVETVFIPADPIHGHVSSSLVKQVADLGGEVTKYVSQSTARALAASAANRKALD